MKSVLSALLLCISSGLFAQPTLTGANSNPVAGEIFYGRYCGPSGVALGASGAGITWNLSGIIAGNYDTTVYLVCAGTAFCDSFPGSTLVRETHGVYNYYIADASRFAFNGYRATGGSQYFSEPENLMMYPMSYGMAKTDSFVSAQPAFSTYGHGVDSFYADGYGTLILPTGTYSNVLRVHVVSISTDSFASVTPAIVEHSRSDVYYWYTPGFHNPLAAVNLDSMGTGVWHITGATYYLYTPPATDVHNVNSSNTSLTVFPNPANSEVQISLNLANGGSVIIEATDMAGRKVGNSQEQLVNGGKTDITFDVSRFSPGIYLLKIQTPQGSELRQIQIVR